MMSDTIAQIFGMTFVGVILICLVWTIISYIYTGMDLGPDKRNKKLLDNMNKLKHK